MLQLKPDEIGTTRRDPETSMNQKVAGKLSTTEPTTSYMMVNEAADEVLYLKCYFLTNHL